LQSPQASGASFDAPRSAVDNNRSSLHVNAPHAIGGAFGVTHIMPMSRHLATDITLTWHIITPYDEVWISGIIRHQKAPRY
jgi:hypothetical protein